MAQTIEYEVEPRDVVAFHLHFAGTPLGRRLRRRNYLIGLVIALGASLLPASALGFLGAALLLLGCIAGYTALFLLVNWVTQRWGAGSIASKSNQLGVLGRHALEIAAEGVTERTAVSTSTWGWDGIVRIERTPTAVLLWLNDAMAHIVPVRAFPGSSDADAFVADAQMLKTARGQVDVK